VKEQQADAVDAYLKEHAPPHLRKSIKARAMRFSAPLVVATGIVTAVEDAQSALTSSGLPEHYHPTVVSAVIKHTRFTDDAVKVVRDLSAIAKAADKAMDDLGILPSNPQRPALYKQVALPRYVRNPSGVKARVNEIWDRKGRIEEELERIHAPSECHTKITSTLMTSRETQDAVFGKAKDLAAAYLTVKKEILDEGHPEVVLVFVGVPAVTYRNPSEGWRRELKDALRRESRHARKGGYVEKTGLDDAGFMELLQKSRSGSEEAKTELLGRFGFLAERSGRSEQWTKGNNSAIEALVMRLPESHFADKPLAEFTAYASYITRLCDMRRARTELIERKRE
jgi:hypothetical protein